MKKLNPALVAPLAILAANLVRLLTGYEMQTAEAEALVNAGATVAGIVAAVMAPKKKDVQK